MPIKHTLREPALESSIESMQSIVSGVRKLHGQYQYSLTPKTKVDVYVRCSEASMVSTLQPFSTLMKTLTVTKELSLLVNEPPPEGCAMCPVSDKCQVYIMLKGLIDVDKETAKMETELEKRSKDVQKLQTAMAAADYETKVPETVREKNSEKVTKLTSEMAAITEAMKVLQLLK